ncbi:MAG: hypothetical protein IIU10_05030, partial [Paludibacteraceae bacterium]|nr:hypothetical protein [Paludibacteraceae bacterium]
MKSKSLILCLLCAMWYGLTVQAQEQELLNYPLDTINGEEVYRYNVERSVGLYRIGVTFNVAQSDIIRLNPQLRERGLLYGELLYLPTGRPVVKATAPAQDKPTTTPAQDKPTTTPAQKQPRVI